MEKVKTVVSIVRNNGKLLLLKRHPNTKHYPNGWSFVCGRIESGERPIDAAYREIEEETGLRRDDLTLVKKAGVYLDVDEDIGITWEINPFLFESKKR